jgi:hypothetical protein
MKRIGLVAVGTAVALAIPTAAAAQSPGPRTIEVVEREKGSTFGFVDNPPRIRDRRSAVLSPGDMFVFSSPLFDAANRRMGRIHVQCVATTRGRENRVQQLCTGALRLRDGRITLATVFRGDPDVVTGVVTGGDGAYAGARGTFRSEDTRTGANDTITLLG